jgi:chaperone BCS1
VIDQVITYFTELLSGNEFFQGGFVLAFLGTLAVWGRSIPTKGWKLIKRLLIVECDIQQRDDAFEAITVWLASQPYGKKVKRFSVTLKEKERAEGIREVIFSPAPGTHWVCYQGRIVRIERGREKLSVGNGDAIAGFYESFTLQTFGKGRGVLERLVRDAIELYAEQSKDRTKVYLQDNYGGWDELCDLPKRSLDSVVLEDGTAEMVVHDMEQFLVSEERYASLGVPYRRGYLFHGPPGTGKSSFCTALAAHFGFGLSVVTLSDPKLTDTLLAKMLSRTRERSLLLLEDVDCLYDESRSAKDAAGVTLSGLLNALDGAQAQTGRIAILTTNCPDSLDPALVRPGRADVRIDFGLASIGQMQRLFSRFFPEASKTDAYDFAMGIGDGKKSVAEVQGMLLQRFVDK